MSQSLAFHRREVAPASDQADVPRLHVTDDRAMLRAAAVMTRDLTQPSQAIYWIDLTVSALVGYAGLAGAVLLPGGWAIAAAIVAVLALYRAESFIHELTHVRHASLPGFRLGWNALVGVPLLTPSFMYEGVHNLHHARTRYGTVEDPEYLPLALMKPWSLPLFVVLAALAPVALLFRFAVLVPLAALFPPLRATLVARYSALAINPAFRRRTPEGEIARWWLGLETAASIWAITLVTLVVTGVVPLRSFGIFIGVVSVMAVVNQVRTLVAHLWENEGEPMTVTAQYLDSVNVPPPALLPVLWAPVGLRYHALHHLLPGLPYHSLAEAHRRLSAALGEASPYHRASYAGLPGLIRRLVTRTMGGR